MCLKAGKWARCPRGQRQAAAIAVRAACSGIANKRHTHTPFHNLRICGAQALHSVKRWWRDCLLPQLHHQYWLVTAFWGPVIL